MNIVMLVRNRYRLTKQTLDSLFANTEGDFTLTIVDDGSGEFLTRQLLADVANRENVSVLSVSNSDHVLGKLKNLGVLWSEKRWGRSDWLYLSDNDAYFTQGWNATLTQTMMEAEPETWVMGGCNHPFHRPTSEYDGWASHLALAGTSWLMRWFTWDHFGPLLETGAPGVCQSEDAEFCQRLIEYGGLVSSINPPVVYDTGITQSDGKPSPGADIKPRVDGVLYL